jgi:hypothetical protein
MLSKTARTVAGAGQTATAEDPSARELARRLILDQTMNAPNPVRTAVAHKGVSGAFLDGPGDALSVLAPKLQRTEDQYIQGAL